MDYNDLYTVVGLVEASCKTIGEDHPRPCLADRRTSNHPGHPRVSGHNESFPKPDFLGTVYCVTYCNKKRGDALFPWIGPLYAVYIIVYWWCITRPSYTHYEHIYIYIHIHNLGTGTLFEASLRPKWKSSSVVPSRQLRRLDSAAGFPLMFQPGPGSNGSETSESKNWKRWGWDGMGTGNGYWVWVLPCFTMLYHVLPCFTMLYHVIPCYTMLYTE